MKMSDYAAGVITCLVVTAFTAVLWIHGYFTGYGFGVAEMTDTFLDNPRAFAQAIYEKHPKEYERMLQSLEGSHPPVEIK